MLTGAIKHLQTAEHAQDYPSQYYRGFASELQTHLNNHTYPGPLKAPSLSK